MEEEEDSIEREIPVYLSKQLSDHLYIYQYPLRQSNLKYDTAVIKSCAIKPQHKEVKLEMSLNINSMNFDMNKAEEIAINTDGAAGFNREKDEEAIFENEIMDKQSFISTKAVDDCSKYAVGIVHGNEIHITPLKGIIQLRPHFPYLDRSDKRARDTEKAQATEVEEVVEEQAQQVTVKFARSENERIRKLKEKSFNYLAQKSAEEPWCHTHWQHTHTVAVELERMKLLSEGQDNVGMALNVSGKQYLKILVPPDKEEAIVFPSLPANVLSLTGLKTLPILEQCRLLLKNVKIITFQQLMLLLAGVDGLNTETVLRTLPQVATIIRGVWVVRSDVLYPKDSRSAISGVPATIMCRARDYVLYLFTQKQYVDRRKVASVIKLPAEEVKEILIDIARFRKNRGWELLHPIDRTFIEKYPDVMQRQELFWEAKQKLFNDLISDSKQVRQRKKSKSVSDEVKQQQNGVKRDRPLGSDSESGVVAKKLKTNHNKTDITNKDEAMEV